MPWHYTAMPLISVHFDRHGFPYHVPKAQYYRAVFPSCPFRNWMELNWIEMKQLQNCYPAQLVEFFLQCKISCKTGGPVSVTKWNYWQYSNVTTFKDEITDTFRISVQDMSAHMVSSIAETVNGQLGTYQQCCHLLSSVGTTQHAQGNDNMSCSHDMVYQHYLMPSHVKPHDSNCTV